MKYKLIVSDLDGTLLRSDGTVSDGTRESIRSFQRNGGYFSIATGRMEDAVKPYVDLLDIQGPVILYNGSKIMNLSTNSVIYESFLDFDIAKTALKLLKKYKWDLLLYQNSKIYIKEMTPGIDKHIRKENVSCEIVGDLHDFLITAPTKILIIGNNEKFGAFAEELQEQVDSIVNITQSETTYLEILPAGATKGTALLKMAKELGISINEVIAIGDHLNDISMVSAAGLGVAMENAHPELKKNADYITVTNEAEGVKQVIDTVLKGLEFNDTNRPDSHLQDSEMLASDVQDLNTEDSDLLEAEVG